MLSRINVIFTLIKSKINFKLVFKEMVKIYVYGLLCLTLYYDMGKIQLEGLNLPHNTSILFLLVTLYIIFREMRQNREIKLLNDEIDYLSNTINKMIVR